MDNLRNTYNIMTIRILFSMICLLGLTFIVSSCYKNDFENTTNLPETRSNDQLKTQFGYALARILADSKDVRTIIREEALKKINYDYDVLYPLIKDKVISSGSTIEELFSQYIPSETLNIIENKMPTLTIFVPTLPEDSFSAETWDTDSMIPEVAIRLSRSNDVPIINANGEEKLFYPDMIPAFPVVVIKENERISFNKFPTTRVSDNNILSKIGLNFIDEAFDNISSNSNTRSITSSAALPGERANMDKRCLKLIEAYKKYPNADGWQRDYIYYDISPTKPNGPFSYLYKECIWGFEMIGDAMAAMRKISDQTDDPRIDGDWHPKPNSRMPSGWTDGEFEFKVKIYLAAKTAVGNELITYFRIEPGALFEVSSKKNSDHFILTDIKNSLVLFRDPIPLFAWNLEEYGSSIKIEIEEVDSNIQTTQTITSTSEFATNFEFNIGLGEKVKMGAKFGASSKTSKTVQYTVTKTEGNDELGQVIVNFGDIVVADTTCISGRSFSVRNRRSIVNLSPQYTTGWYRVLIAPCPINN